MELITQLKRLGLNQSECTVYLFLLKNGCTSPPIVSRETMIARTNCYNLLRSLEVKGLIEERLVGKRKAYVARKPGSIISMLEVQRQAALGVLPDLEAMYTNQKHKPRISFYDGWDEIQQVFIETYNSTAVMFVGSVSDFVTKEPIFAVYQQELKKRQIAYRELDLGIVSRGTVANEQAGTLFLLWNDCLSIITLQDTAFATTIKHKTIADTFHFLFRVLEKR